MLKFIIVFGLISSCHSGSLLDFHELIFIQRTPVTAFYNIQNELENQIIDSEQKTVLLNRHAMGLLIFDSKRWIIHALDALNSNNAFEITCTDIYGVPRLYKDNVLPPNFKEELKLFWPSTYAGAEDESVWEASYDLSGSCIASDPLTYFHTSTRLLSENNVGEILDRARIYPDFTYSAEYLRNAIIGTIGVLPYLKCLPPQVPYSKYQLLFEVHLCINQESKLIDCHHPVRDLCAERPDIYYPNWQQN